MKCSIQSESKIHT